MSLSNCCQMLLVAMENVVQVVTVCHAASERLDVEPLALSQEEQGTTLRALVTQFNELQRRAYHQPLETAGHAIRDMDAATAARETLTKARRFCFECLR